MARIISVAKGTGGVTKLVEAYKAQYVELVPQKRNRVDARNVVPMIPSNQFQNLGASSQVVTYKTSEFTSGLNITQSRSSDLPLLVYKGTPKSDPLVFVGLGISNTKDEADAIMNGDLVPTNKTNDAITVVLEGENSLIYHGFSKLGVKGLANITGKRVFAMSDTLENLKAKPSDILEEFTKAYEEFTVGNKFIPNSLVINRKFFSIMEKQLSEYKTQKLVDAIANIGGGSMEITYSSYIVDENGKETIMFGEKDPNNYGFVEVVPAEPGEEYADGRDKIVPVEEKLSGVIARRPEAVMMFGGLA